jgi:hypothetical protein
LYLSGLWNNFSDVPFQDRLGGIVAWALGRAERCAVKSDNPFLKSSGSVGALRHDDVQFVGKREDAAVKELVVQRAEGKAVEFRVRPAGLVPFDMGRLQCVIELFTGRSIFSLGLSENPGRTLTSRLSDLDLTGARFSDPRPVSLCSSVPL